MSKSEKIFSVSEVLEIRPDLRVLSGSEPEGATSPSREEFRAKVGVEVELRLPDGQRMSIRPVGKELKHDRFSGPPIYLLGFDPKTIPEGLEITQGTEVWSLPG